MYASTKLWLEEQRRHGRFVDKTDLLQECEARVHRKLAYFEARLKDDTVQLSVDERKVRKACEKFLESISSTDDHCLDNRRYRTGVIMDFCGASFLPPDEEKRRAQATWRCQDLTRPPPNMLKKSQCVFF